MFDFTIKDHKPLRDMVYEELRKLILTGKLKPETRMMEIELAEEMGVSRTPIREAIRKLEEEGLVIIEPRRGAYVSGISVSEIVNILEVRETLDGLAAALATERITNQEKEKMLEIHGLFNKAVRDGDTEQMIKYDIDFHSLIVESSKNSFLIHSVERIQELVLRFRYIYFKDFKRAEEMPEEHMRIYTAIYNGDVDTARKEAEMHITKLKMLIKDDDFIRQ